MKIKSSGYLLGHKGRCFDTRLLSGNRLLTASEDGTAKIINTVTKQQEISFNHGSETEVLRAACVKTSSSVDNSDELICTCGANGLAYIWSSDRCVAGAGCKFASRREFVLQHNFPVTGQQQQQQGKPADPAQIYSCEALSAQDGLFITAADDWLRLWNLEGKSTGSGSSCGIGTPGASGTSVRELLPQQALQFTAYTGGAGGGAGGSVFGGVRNPDDLCYIFDAKVAPGLGGYGQNAVVGVACSDGTTRLVDLRASMAHGQTAPVCTQMLPINQFLGIDTTQANVRGLYPTSLTFDDSGGHVVLISLSNGYILICDARQNLLPVSVIPAHQSACYGCAMLPTTRPSRTGVAACSNDRANSSNNSDSNSSSNSSNNHQQQLLLSWGGDGYVRTWDLTVDYTLPPPVSTLVDGTESTVGGNGHYSNALREFSLNSSQSKSGNSSSSSSNSNMRTSVYSCCVEAMSLETAAVKPMTTTAASGSSVGYKLRAYCGVSSNDASTPSFMGTPIPILELDVD